MRHWGLQHARVGALPAPAHIVHPGAAALARTGGWVEVELAHQLAVALDPEELDGRVPDGRLVGADVHLKQGLDDFEQTGQHLGRCEVLLDLLFAEAVAGFFEFFAQVGHVPGVEGAGDAQGGGGEVAQIGQVFFCEGAGFGGQVAQKGDDFFGGFGHFGHDRHLGVVGKTQQTGFLLAKRQDFLHQGRVVEVLGVIGGLV